MSAADEEHEPDSFETEGDDFVPALLARDLAEAQEYCDLLSDHDIPARVGVDDEPLEEGSSEQRLAGRRGMTHGVPVLVPETLLDEASEVIADRDDFSDFDEDDEDDDDEDEDDDAFVLEELDSDEDGFLDDEEEEPLLEEEDESADGLGGLDEDEDEEDGFY